LTNKTLTTPIISSISNTGTLTLPTSTDTLVGRDTIDTLTNKTLTAPAINNATGITTDSLSVANNADVSGTLDTVDINSTGNITASGDVSGTTISATTLSAPTLKTNEISSDDSTAVQINDGLNINGSLSVSSGFNTILGDITVYSNNITAPVDTDINIVTSGSGQIILNASRVGAGQINASTVALSGTLDTNSIRSFETNADITIEPQGTGIVDVTSTLVASNILTGVTTSTISAGVLTLDFKYGTHIVAHDANITSITFTNASASKSGQVTVILTQDVSGGKTIAGSYLTAGGLGLDISTAANAVNIITFLTRDNSTFYGFSNGKNFG
jgi:hypothetical protein